MLDNQSGPTDRISPEHGKAGVLTMPTIHSNGTSAKSLQEGYLFAYRAVSEAIKRAQDGTHPDGRDYYPQPIGAIEKAREEHRDRLRRLQGVADEYLALAEHVSAFL